MLFSPVVMESPGNGSDDILSVEAEVNILLRFDLKCWKRREFRVYEWGIKVTGERQ